MRKHIILLTAVIVLYFVPSLILQAIYGPSFGFLSGEDCWVPNGNGGWFPHGQPLMPPPDVPSVNVPMVLRYIPIFAPGLLLILFLFTPLSAKLDKPKHEEPATDIEPSDDPDNPPHDI